LGNGVKTLSLFHPVRFLATGCGSGCVPKIGGTTGSLFACLLAWPIHSLGGPGLLIAGTVMFFLGILVCHFYLRAMPSNPDPKEVVIDEIAAQWLLLSVLPQSLIAYVVGFVLFRFFDVLKPFPISYADCRYKGAFGIMFDDLLAAMYPVLLFLLTILMFNVFGAAFPLDSMLEFLSGRKDVYFVF
jgi:phosphatidylglycerophosphatase A